MAVVGIGVGFIVGVVVGCCVGKNDGVWVDDGAKMGSEDGARDRLVVGAVRVGGKVGCSVGRPVCATVGTVEGALVLGARDEEAVGPAFDVAVGASVRAMKFHVV